MRIESRAIKLLLNVGGGPKGREASFEPPPGAENISGTTVYAEAEGFFLLVTWVMPVTDDEKAEAAARKAQSRAVAGGLLVPPHGQG